MSISYEKVLKYWLGEDLNSLNSEIYMHNPKLWFQLKKTTDDQINSLFGETLTKAEKDSLPSDWKSNPRGQIALIILFDQFSRNVYRGTKDMFKNDEKALKIALELVDNKLVFDQLSPIEKFFVYLTLIHTENVDLAKQGLDAIERLSQEAPTLQKHHFTKYYNSSKVHYELLLKYGRYPHRNLLLGRESSQDELDFLQKSKHTFVRSVLPLKDPNSDKKPQANKKNDSNKRLMLPYQRLFFLHGFRQSANKLRKRLSYMINRMKTDCNAHVTFINGTHPYRPNGDTAHQMESTLGPNVLMPIESQRIWFNSDDNAQVYNGIDESIAYILTHVNLHGPYDGIIGFGQGAALASILVAKHPNLFSYLISISGFQPRSIVHKDLISESKPLKIPSLHIYGKSDILITPSRSELFSKCFVESQTAEHPAGHFAPNSWPIDRLTEFVKNQAENLKFPKSFASNQPLEISVVKLEEALVRYDLDKLDLAPLFQSDWARNLIRSDLYLNYFENNPEKSSELLINEFKSLKNDENLEDKILIVHVLLIRAKDKEKNSETKEYTYSILNIFLWVYYLNAESKRDFFHENIIPKLFINLNKWKELILLCDLSYRVDGDDEKKKSLRLLYDFLIKLFVNQLAVDLSIVDRKNRTCLVQMLTSPKLIDENKSNINDDETELRTSDLSKHMPRIKSHIDKQSRIARECANLINPFEHLLTTNSNNNQDSYQVAKILSYNHYRKVLTNICAFADSVRIEHEFSSPNVHLSTAKFNRAAMEHLMKAPLSDAIINPVPEPVDVSSYEQMKPLYDWLAQNITLDETDLKFLRGTVTTDGRLDLCKQVIGPQGIKPLLDAMKGSKQVDRLLLGNNIIGDGGGKIIADFIRSGKSPLTVWYIAGNHLTVDGITPICEALKHDSQVTALWLKRNPLKPAGMRPIADLFKYNRTIEVLDLLNCGLLDEGVKILFDSLEENNPLKHVYLSANGITSVGLQSIAEFYRRVESNLETLFLGCNRIENRGAEIIGDILKHDKKLVRLNVASSRIGSEGMRSIAEALLNHPSLMNLDLGYTRSTMDLGELGNFIEDEGAIYLANVIGKTDKLISLSITHNHITQRGMQLLVDALEFNNSLLQFDYVQFGTSLNEVTLTQMRAYLGRNRFLLKQNKPDFDPNAVLMPEHVKQVYSVYRTH